jgi:arylsulfatase A-like enzyme
LATDLQQIGIGMGKDRTSSRQPNIILMVLDTVRHDRLSCYGYGRPTTPNLERLAAESTLFTQCIAPATWTLPAHASIFTGVPVNRHGVDGQVKRLGPGLHTLAQVLAAVGYETFGASPIHWISDATDLSRGFQHFVGLWNPAEGRGALGRVFGQVYNLLYFRRYDKGSLLTNWLLRRWLDGRDTARPFFLFVNYFEAHLPYRPPAKYRYAFLREKPREPASQDALAYITGNLQMTGAVKAELDALYDAGILYLDHRVGQLLAYLRQKGLLDDTILLVTSDHGENVGDHNHLGHRYIPYETLVHVPLLARWPAAFAPGQQVDTLVQTTDILPTLLALLELEPARLLPQALSGHTLLSGSVHREVAVAENVYPMLLPTLRRRFPDFDASVFDRARRKVRTLDYSFIWSSDGRHELYDLQADPGELHDLAADQPEVVANLARQLDEYLAAWPRLQPEQEETSLDQDVVRRLQALGYL